MDCHGDPDIAPDPRLEQYGESVHAWLDCTDCHEGVADYPHAGEPSRVNCGECHEQQTAGIEGAAHGRELIDLTGSPARACAACHGHAHDMPPLTSENAPTARANQIRMCGACHADSRSPPSVAAVYHPLDSYLSSIHGELNLSGRLEAALCSDCHGTHDIRPKYDPLSSIFASNISRTCGRCHELEASNYRTSIHGVALALGVREAPTCTDCHGEHGIRPPNEAGSRVSKTSISRTCSGCHAAEHINAKYSMPADRIRTFETSYHGLAARGGSRTAANCASCHAWHNVLPASDPASTVHPSNLARTCGECHPGAATMFADVSIHGILSGAGSPVARTLEILYMILIPLVVGSMIVHNTLDLVRKSRARENLPPARLHPEIRMSLHERLQHGVMVVAFLVLGYSGFALKYPDAWWALPFRILGGEEGRRIFHRAAAIFFALVCVWHVAWLFFAREGRVLLKDMILSRRDLSDILGSVRFYLRLQTTRPALPRYSYIEKAEYWALVWGTLIMLITGAVLLFHNVALQYGPLWVLDAARVVHYMEAVLACLAILVWHFYWVIYDPDVYPMNVAWITGRHVHRNHPQANKASAPVPVDAKREMHTS